MISFRLFFRVCCIFSAFISTLWPIYIYNLDEDLVQIDFKQFHTAEDRVYPALTLCFDTTTYSTYNESFERSLREDELLQIGSNHTTLKIEDYVNSIQFQDFENKITRYSKSGIGIESHNEIEIRQLSTNTVFRRYQASRCFAIGLPFMNKKVINSMDIGINKNIFKSGNAPTSDELINGIGQMSMGLSYQNQYFPLLRHHRKNELESKATLCSGVVLNIRGMEILRRRNKAGKPCNDYANEEAIEVLKDVVTKLECKPQYWDFPSPLPDCSETQLNRSRELLDNSLYDSNAAKSLIQPCRSILDLWYDYDFDNLKGSCSDTLHISIIFNNLPFKEISFVPAYTIWNLISSISVVIGFFLGFSLIQLPDLLLKLKKKMKKKPGSCHYTHRILKRNISLMKKDIDKLKKDIEVLKDPIIKRLKDREHESCV